MIRSLILFPIFIFAIAFAFASQISAKDMTFDIIYANHSNFVVADGEITADTPSVFQDFLDTKPFDGFTYYIDLNSPGGNLLGGMELGKMIRAQGLIARVMSYAPRALGEDYWYPREEPGICMSACALAFLGGDDRELDSRSILGFHQFSSVGSASGKVESVQMTEASTQVISGLVHEYIVTMGASPTLFSRMSMTLPDEIFIPSTKELQDFNIIPPEAFSNFTLEPYGSGIIAYSILPENVQGRNIVSQITAYCRNGIPYLLLSKPETMRPLTEGWLNSANEMLDGFSLWRPPGTVRVDYPASNVDLRIGGQTLAEIRIDARGIEILMGEVKGNVQLPGVLGTSMYFLIQPTDPDKNILRSAFQLCID